MTLMQLRVNEKQISRKDLAKKSGLSPAYIRDLEQGHRKLHGASGETLEKLAIALDVTIEELLTCSVEMTLYGSIDETDVEIFETWFPDEKKADDYSVDDWERLTRMERKHHHLYTVKATGLFYLEDGEWVPDPDDAATAEYDAEPWYFDSARKDSYRIEHDRLNLTVIINDEERVHFDLDGLVVEGYEDAAEFAEDDLDMIETQLGRKVSGAKERDALRSDLRDFYEDLIK